MKSFHRRTSRPAPTPHPQTSAAVERVQPRADHLLVEQGLAPSRTAARALIEAGRVSCEGKPVSKPAQTLPASARLAVTPDPDDRFVSRAELKLAVPHPAASTDPSAPRGRTMP